MSKLHAVLHQRRSESIIIVRRAQPPEQTPPPTWGPSPDTHPHTCKKPSRARRRTTNLPRETVWTVTTRNTRSLDNGSHKGSRGNCGTTRLERQLWARSGTRHIAHLEPAVYLAVRPAGLERLLHTGRAKGCTRVPHVQGAWARGE